MKTTRQFFKPLLFVCYLFLTCWTFNGQNPNLITPDGLNGNWWTGSELACIDDSGLSSVPSTWGDVTGNNVTHISPANIFEATYSPHNNNFANTMTFTFNPSKNIDGMVLWQPCGAYRGGDAPFNKIEIVSEKCGIITRDTLVMGLPSENYKRFDFTPKYGITSITLNILETWVNDDLTAEGCDDNATWTSTDINSVFDGEYNYLLGEIKFIEAEFTGDDVDCEAGAYCCDGENLVENGNFEFGDIGFTSAYTQTIATYPGEYDVTTTANAFGATVNDHSYCVDSTQYPNNNFLVVNGKTQQSGNNYIWAQALSGLEDGVSYKFCANFKNMPQCTFDILPNITMIGGNSTIANQIINTTGAPCDWQSIEMTFVASGPTETVAIFLDETGNGDGNDVAIDDIGVFRLDEPNLDLIVTHEGINNEITATVNSSNVNFEECTYYWFAAEVSSYPPVVIDGATLAWGNQLGNSVTPPFPNGTPWLTPTTTFQDYIFNQDTLYIIGMYVLECECYAEGFNYQLTYNNHGVEGDMTEAQEQQIKDWILNGYKGTLSTSNDDQRALEDLKIYPNPAKNNFNISLVNDTIESVKIFSITGKSVFEKQLGQGRKEETIDVSILSTGIYFVNVIGENQKQYTAKLVKE